MAFTPKTLDFNLSPYTGYTRKTWIEAGEYFLNGIFQHIPNFHAPIVMPRKETKITYPHLNASEETQAAERKAEIFEGLTRSFFIAAPLIHDNPELTICGYNMKDYYKNQILRACTSGDPICAGTYEELMEITGDPNPFRAFQQTVETCALVICLWITKEEIWDTYTKEAKDIIANFISSFAHASTVPQNWRLFNMLDLAFLNMEGYPIDKEIMLDHAQAILNYYVGDGWYRDGHSFDYYSCWAFNVYAPLWNLWYGYENEPLLAKKFEENSNKLMETYADFFDADGFTNMWGRSNIYRNASTSAFDGNFFLKNPKMNPGLARRISSGSLIQFFSRDDFTFKGVPTLGFYGQFAPLVQGYSCAESPFWFGKAFLCLHLPESHPFWSEKENNGTWDELEGNEIKETVLNGPALCFTNHKANGETILRTGKVLKRSDDIHGMWNYSKLSFNTKYPWESTPIVEVPKDELTANEPCNTNKSTNAVNNTISAESVSTDTVNNIVSEEISSNDTINNIVKKEFNEIESQQYVLKDITTGELSRANVTFWCDAKEDILYRRQFFDYRPEHETHWRQAMNLADFAVPYGIMRVDKMRLHRRPISLTLGAYGFPDNGTEIIEKQSGNAKAIILKGKDYTGREKQLAMTIYDGWKKLKLVHSTGTNPDSEKSIVIYAYTESLKQYGGYEPYVLISQVITKESHEDFTEDELFPVKEIIYEDLAKTGAYGDTVIVLKDGSRKCVNFEGIEARMMI